MVMYAVTDPRIETALSRIADQPGGQRLLDSMPEDLTIVSFKNHGSRPVAGFYDPATRTVGVNASLDDDSFTVALRDRLDFQRAHPAQQVRAVLKDVAPKAAKELRAREAVALNQAAETALRQLKTPKPKSR